MRHTILLLSTMMLALLLAGGVGLAANIHCQGGQCLGTQQNDLILGSQVDDLILAFDGIDRVNAHQGDDGVIGGDGGDQIAGAEGADVLNGHAGDDDIRGGPGTLADGEPLTTVTCGPVGDVTTVFNQEMTGGDGNDSLTGGDDNDGLFGDAGLNVLSGKGGGDCFLLRGDANERVSGGDGDDVVFAFDGTGDDISCGAGIDAVRADVVEDRVAGDCEQVFGPSSLQATGSTPETEVTITPPQAVGS
jgi:Ca2+-binding RTX toxin-like protein